MEIIEEIIKKDDANWQYIIYELVKTKQIDPWNIDIINLTTKFLEKIEEMDRKGLYISSKLILIAAILIRLKTEILIQSLIKKEETKKIEKERIILNEEIPDLIPKIPFDRERRITLEELIKAINEAIKTEERRIRKQIYLKRHVMEIDYLLTKKRIDWRIKIKEIYKKILKLLNERKIRKILFDELIENKEEKINTFIALLYLDFQKKINLEQKNFLGEIEINLNAGVPELGRTGRT
ncbi:MAG: segregation/condensation protein A [Candidatus Pacearchaeota archaeon]